MPDESPPSIAELKKWFAYHLVKDWPALLKHPFAFAAVVAFAFTGCYFLLWKEIVPAKDEQLKIKAEQVSAKDATIQQKDATIQQLQTVLFANGLNTFPLKKRGMIIADQLEKLADNMPKEDWKRPDYTLDFDRRFLGTRVPIFISDCDQQGAHLNELDQSSELWQELRRIPVEAASIRKLAGSIRALAGQLKD